MGLTASLAKIRALLKLVSKMPIPFLKKMCPHDRPARGLHVPTLYQFITNNTFNASAQKFYSLWPNASSLCKINPVAANTECNAVKRITGLLLATKNRTLRFLKNNITTFNFSTYNRQMPSYPQPFCVSLRLISIIA